MGPGQTAAFPVTLTAGTYGLICFATDPATRQPHFALGMMAEFTVP
jgi:hypothetical protein